MLRGWLLVEYGDGKTAPCCLCGKTLTLRTVTIDHYPIPACLGGTYDKNNVRPLCYGCNQADGRLIDDTYTGSSRWEEARRRRARGRIRRGIAIDRRREELGHLSQTIGDAVGFSS